jgi:hypothetical protein
MSSGERGSQTLKEALGAGSTAGVGPMGISAFDHLPDSNLPAAPTGQPAQRVNFSPWSQWTRTRRAIRPRLFWHINSISRWSVVHQVLVLSNSPPDGNQVFVEVVRHCLSCTRSVYAQQCKR